MDFLVDTHVLIWWMEDSVRLSNHAADLMRDIDNQVFISAAVGWEISIKINTGKMKQASILDGLSRVIQKESFSEITINLEMAIRAGLLPPHHRDPFDRMLVAQSQILNVPILSADAALDRYDVRRIW